MYGGLTPAFEMPSSLCTFDFATLTWSRAELIGAPLPARMAHMATAHEGAMVIMGGVLMAMFIALISTVYWPFDMTL